MKRTRLAGGSLLLGFLTMMLFAGSLTVSAQSSLGYYQTDGNRIVDRNGQAAVFNGVNWFGFETENYALHGLWTRSMTAMLDQIEEQGYNLLRIPYSNQMFDDNARVQGVDFYQNPDLQNLRPIEVLDRLVEEAGKRGIQILLDRHRPDASGQAELWYTDQYSEQRWIEDWVMLAKRYKGNATVIGADLHNEPHGRASWGSDDLATDWRLAAERAGNAILKANADWLIVVEGVERNVKGQEGNYWWGGNLSGAREYPVRLDVANRLVYSTHDYGEGVYGQTWFYDAAFPANLPALWEKYWAYLHLEEIAPVLIGEFGGRQIDRGSKEGIWQNALIDYIDKHQLYWTYWSLNPNSGDTGGLLLDDWQTWDTVKQSGLSRIMRTPSDSVETVPDRDEPALWAKDAIAAAITKALVPERLQSAYNRPITREEFAELIVQTLQAKVAAQQRLASDNDALSDRDWTTSAILRQVSMSRTFDDSKADHVTLAYLLGVANGVGEGQFAPDRPIFRQEAATMLTNALRAYPQLEEADSTIAAYADAAAIAAWARHGVTEAGRMGLLMGLGDRFDPLGYLTREQAIAVMLRLHDLSYPSFALRGKLPLTEAERNHCYVVNGDTVTQQVCAN